MNSAPMSPKDFTDRFPRYVYRSQKRKATVQWRGAALDMAKRTDALAEALRKALNQIDALQSALEVNSDGRLNYVGLKPLHANDGGAYQEARELLARIENHD